MNFSATYSPEDNKLRLYATSRLSPELYARVKAAGFRWAPKQELFVAPSWSPGREDLLLELADEIGDEDYSPEERAADRAERFSGYRDKRRGEASGHADRYDSGPAVFGHHHRQRAERQAARHDRVRGHAVSQWSKAEYWQSRTEGVIAHALYRSSARVRRSRILRLEAEQRKHEKSREEYAKQYAAWKRLPTLEGPNMILAKAADGYVGTDLTLSSEAGQLAYYLANHYSWQTYAHPRTGKESTLYSHLTDAVDPITPAEAAALWLDGKREPGDPEGYSARWSAHYELRLGYERAMLAEEGGSAAEAEIEPGGWIQGSRRTGSVFTAVTGGWMQVHAVNRSPVTKRVVSVKVMGVVGIQNPKPGLVSINVERLGEDAYRAPTDEEREAFKAATKAAKAAAKASKPKSIPLVNPTDDDAERLQAERNRPGQA